MSVDEIREALVIFTDRFSQLNKTLRASFTGLKEAHDEVDPLWRDTMRQQYDSAWQNLDEEMQIYINDIGPDLLEKLASDLGHSRVYLGE